MQFPRGSDAPPPSRRRAVAAMAGAVTLLACTPDVTEPPQPTPDAEAVLQSREALGAPMLALAEAVIAVEEGIDDARHRARRGEQMEEVLDEVAAGIGDVAGAVDEAREAAAQADIAEAAEIVDHAAAAADGAQDAMRAEVAFLRDVVAIDRALLAAAASWDERGSQSEIRARLAGVADDLARTRARARALEPVPASCDIMQRNRRRWTRVVRRRTRNLAGQANSAGGRSYDRLRAAYRPLPFAEEPRSADRRDRTCWEEQSEVVAAAEVMRAAVDELRSTLSG